VASYTPRHVAEKILTSRSVLEGAGKQAAQARFRVAPQPAQNFRPSRFSPPRSRKRPHPASAMVQDVPYGRAAGTSNVETRPPPIASGMLPPVSLCLPDLPIPADGCRFLQCADRVGRCLGRNAEGLPQFVAYRLAGVLLAKQSNQTAISRWGVFADFFSVPRIRVSGLLQSVSSRKWFTDTPTNGSGDTNNGATVRRRAIDLLSFKNSPSWKHAHLAVLTADKRPRNRVSSVGTHDS
jgi:hypothetical protein